MARRNYPFHKSADKFGTNLVSSLIALFIITGVNAIAYIIAIIQNKKRTNDNSPKKTPKNIVIFLFLTFGIITLTWVLKSPHHPISVKHLGRAYNQAYNDLYNNITKGKNPIFWDSPISWIMTKYDLKDIQIYPVIFNGKKLEAEVEYTFGAWPRDNEYWSDKLKCIHLKMPYQEAIEKELTAYYGDKYIHIYYPHSNNYYNTWIFDKHSIVIERYRDNDST